MVISSNKTITIDEISDILKIPKRTVEREIKNFAKVGRLHVVEEDDMGIGRLYSD